MKRTTIDQLREGGIAGDFFVVAQCDRKTTRTNKPYLDAVFSDATGRIPGRVWDNVDRLARVLVPGKVVRLEASVESFKGELQLKVMDARPLRENDKVDPSDFMPKTPHDIDHLYRQLIEYKNSVANPQIRALLDCFFENEEFSEKFRRHPAAKRIHHAYAGGLLEHTLFVARTCDAMTHVYAYLNRDILIAGALLHDIGKVEEMSAELAVEYTAPGQLLGHLTIGSDMVARAADSLPDFPESVKLQLQHLVLSHHGRLDFGSPVPPMTLEGLVLHSLDMLDANLFQAKAAIDDKKESDADFTERVFGLDRRFYTRVERDADSSVSAAPVAPLPPESEELDLSDETPTQESLL